jgi:hypothetical protein
MTTKKNWNAENILESLVAKLTFDKKIRKVFELLR